MKKIFSLIFIIFLFILLSLNNSNFTYFFNIDKTAEVSFYCTSKNAFKDSTILINGDKFVIKTTAQNAQNIYNNIKGCEGISIKIKKENLNLNNILNKSKIINVEKIENNKIYYLFLNNLIYFTFLDNKKINLQIAELENCYILGTPLILGSF